MNLLECKVEKILGVPFFKYDKWWRKVEYECYGLHSKIDLMFDKEEDAINLQVGHVFLA